MRSAIVGCGNVAQVHAKAIAQLKKVNLVADVEDTIWLLLKIYGR